MKKKSTPRGAFSACQKSQICAYQRIRAAEGSGPYRIVLAVICVIMVKNTVTRWIFRRKSNETAPKRGTKLSKSTQRHAVARFFDSLEKHPEGCFFV